MDDFSKRSAEPPATNQEPDAHSSTAPYLALSVWLGLGTGVAEGVAQLIRIASPSRVVRLSNDVLWMAPLANVITFAAIGGILTIGVRRWPRQINHRVAVAVLVTTAFFALSGLSTRISAPARFILAIGVGVQSSHFVLAHRASLFARLNSVLGRRNLFGNRKRPGPMAVEAGSGRLEELLEDRRSFLIGAGASVSGLAAGVNIWKDGSERSFLSSLSTPAPNLPNVLLIVLDTVRAQSTSLHGYSRPTTKGLEQLADRGSMFERAYASAPWTLPSHASMFTGRWPFELVPGWGRPFDDKFPTLAEELSRQGYETAGFVANNLYCSKPLGLSRGFGHYQDFTKSAGQVISSSVLSSALVDNPTFRNLTNFYDSLGRKTAPQVNDEFLKWLSGRNSGRPFFAFLNYYDAHAPYMPPRRFSASFSPESIPRGYLVETMGFGISDELIREYNDAYDSAIAYLDHYIGLLFENLERRNILSDTLVVITSDHGEQFGEHGLLDHGNSLYLPNLHVPLILSFPGRIPSGKRVNQAVSLRNLPATILDLAQIDSSVYFPGHSVAPLWDDEQHAWEDGAIAFAEVTRNTGLGDDSPATRGNLNALILDGMHYIVNFGDGGEELFDIETDPGELHDLVAQPESDRLLAHMRAMLGRVRAGNI